MGLVMSLNDIRIYCLYCCKGSAYEVNKCEAETCLYNPWRMKVTPKGANMTSAQVITLKCDSCGDAMCPSNCPTVAYWKKKQAKVDAAKAAGRKCTIEIPRHFKTMNEACADFPSLFEMPQGKIHKAV